MLSILKNKTPKKNTFVFFFGVLILFGLLTPTHATFAGLGDIVGNSLLSLAAMFVWLGGSMLDNMVNVFVLGMGALINTGQAGTFQAEKLGEAIDATWTVIRDFANLAFIFGFVTIGIKTIIDSDSANTKRLLASLIIGALLINFSLFITQSVVDISNKLASEIYSSLGGSETGIAYDLMNQLGLTTVYNPKDGFSLTDLNDQISLSFFVSASIFIMIAGFTFLAGAVLLAIRFVALVLIMIFSPILFAATVFSGTKNLSSKLWGKLFSYAFFAPVYLLFLLISLKVAEALAGGNAGVNGFAEALRAENNETFSVVLVFLLIIIFIIMSLTTAQKLSIVGGSKAISIGHSMARSARGYVGSATFGTVGAAGRRTIGQAGHNNINNQQWMEKNEKTFSGRRKIGLAKLSAGATFDPRNVAGAGKKLGIGTSTNTYNKTVADKKKKADEYAKSLGQVSDDDPQVKARQAQVDQQKDTLRLLKEEKNRMDINDVSGRAEKQKNIDEAEETLQKQKDLVEQEKNRAVLGSSFDSEAAAKKLKAKEANLSGHQDAMKEAAKKHSEAKTSSDKKAAKKALAAAKKALKEEELEIKKLKRLGGMAGRVENQGFITNLFTGTNSKINKSVSDELRKKYSKKIKGDSDKSAPKKSDSDNKKKDS